MHYIDPRANAKANSNENIVALTERTSKILTIKGPNGRQCQRYSILMNIHHKKRITQVTWAEKWVITQATQFLLGSNIIVCSFITFQVPNNTIFFFIVTIYNISIFLEKKNIFLKIF